MDSVFRKNETRLVFTEDVTDEFGNGFNRKVFGIKYVESLMAESALLNNKTTT